jgi:O-succinylbenzoic acid--CoA ligase
VRGTPDEILGLLRDWDASPDEPELLVVETSGSTGRPKRVLLSRHAMRASADATHARLGGPGQWLLTLPPTYVAGLQVLFRCVRAGTDPVVHTASDLGASRDAMTGERTYVSLVPTQLHRMTADGSEVQALARFDAVLIGGGPLRPEERADAESMDVTVVQTYGMSETCGGCVYDGLPLDGVEISIDDGRVLLGGPTLFDGYEGDPELTASVLREGWFRTDDLGSLDDTGRLTISGRADDVIITGGVKVPATAVADMLRADPHVGDVVVVGVPDAEWGEAVVAVLTCNGSRPDFEELRARVTPREWAPKREFVLDELPRLPNGKVDRVTVKRMLTDD